MLGLSLFWLSLKNGRLLLAFVAGLCGFLMISFRIPSATLLVCVVPPIWEAISRRQKPWLAILLAALGTATGCSPCGFTDRRAVIGAISSLRSAETSSTDRSIACRWRYRSSKRRRRATHPAESFTNRCAADRRRGNVARAATNFERGEKFLLATFGLWLLAALAHAYPGSRHYAHYYHLIWPTIAVVSGLWFAPLRRRVRSSTRSWPTLPQLIDRLAFSLAAGVVLMVLLAQLSKA